MSGSSGVDYGEIGAVAGGFVAAVLGWWTTKSGRRRASQVEESIEELREDQEWDRQRLDTAMGHIYDQNRVLRDNGIPVPELPEQLRARPRPRRGYGGHGHDDQHDDD